MRRRPAILIMLHCKENTGYAISRLEAVFQDAAMMSGYLPNEIYWSYPQRSPESQKSAITVDYQGNDYAQELVSLCKGNNVKTALAFDLPYPSLVIKYLRASGVDSIASYWGASMSSINTGMKLLAKKAEWYIRRNKPDLFIFESEAMRTTATNGRGIPEKSTVIIRLGVDLNRFRPAWNSKYAHSVLGIPEDRKIVIYSGHMEERKGVRVIIMAAIQLIDVQGHRNIHFVLCGNRHNEAEKYLNTLSSTKAAQFVTFAGYRADIEELMRSASVGVIASTGWDSFTMSSVEMMSSGLPLIVSDLQGLSETISNKVNGYLFPPSDHLSLARKIAKLVGNDELRTSMSIASRNRASRLFSRNTQVHEFAKILNAFR